MRVVIDECIDERFRNSLPEHDCQTVRYARAGRTEKWRAPYNAAAFKKWTGCAAEFPLELHEGRSDGADIPLLRFRPAQRQAKEVSSYNIHLTVLKYL
jgi:hypothetical protein